MLYPTVYIYRCYVYIFSIDMTHRLVGPHGEEVGHERREAGGETALCDKAQLEFGQTHRVITALPVPTRNIQKVSLNVT